MRIAVIQATSQLDKNKLIFDSVKKYAPEAEIYNFGCTENEKNTYSYIEISVLIGLLLASSSVDFVVTGCSSGQGMMLACNNIPGVLCGYAPTPKDAYLFAQINNGNAISLPLGEEYTWGGEENLEQTIAGLFSEPFGQGYPRKDSERKLKDTALLKNIRKQSQIEAVELLDKLDKELIRKIMFKEDVINFILSQGTEQDILDWVRKEAEIKVLDNSATEGIKTLYVSDLDGTLLLSNERTSDYTNEVINNLTSKGMLFSYATARSLITAKKAAGGIDARIPLIVYNGAFIVDNVTGEILRANYFDKHSAEELLNTLFENEIYPIVARNTLQSGPKVLELHVSR